MLIRSLFFLLFPLITYAQTFSHGRFVARNNAIFWTERFDVKDMDEPIIAQTVREQLEAKKYVCFDTLQEHEVLSGWLIDPPASTIAKARFRIDILFEKYQVTVSDMLESGPFDTAIIENSLLQSDGNFSRNLSKRLEKLDRTMMEIFEIKQ
ncbi:hypothetical protein [Runella sp.]|uniref:hypothetical protein n=1 Tax=Runella sp. TaxID=1960881 RepID=UPI003D0D1A53